MLNGKHQNYFGVYHFKNFPKSSHCKSVEAAIDNGDSAGHKRRGIRDKVVDSAAQLLGRPEAFKRGLAYYVGTALGEAAVGVGEQRTVLVRQEEALAAA